MFRQVAQLALARVASLMLRDAALHAIGCKPEMMALGVDASSFETRLDLLSSYPALHQW